MSVVAIYSGNLVAILSVKKTEMPFQTLEELAAHPDYQAGVFEGSGTMDRFKVTTVLIFRSFQLVCLSLPSCHVFLSVMQNAESQSFGDVWNKNIQKNSENILSYAPKRLRAAFSRAQRENFAILSDRAFLSYYVEDNQMCNMRVSVDRFARNNYAFVVNKEFPHEYLDAFNARSPLTVVARTSLSVPCVCGWLKVTSYRAAAAAAVAAAEETHH